MCTVFPQQYQEALESDEQRLAAELRLTELRTGLEKATADMYTAEQRKLEAKMKALEITKKIKPLENHGTTESRPSRSWQSMGMTVIGLTAVGTATLCCPPSAPFVAQGAAAVLAASGAGVTATGAYTFIKS